MERMINNLNHYNVSQTERKVNFESKINFSVDSGTEKPSIRESKYVEPQDRIEKLKEIYSEKVLKKMGVIPCETCEARTYVDGSDDPGVSFKTPTNISPEASESAVASHEGEHVANETSKARQEGREVVSQSVQTFKAICPECGRMYTSGGVTKTTTAAKSEYGHADSEAEGNLVDMMV